MDFVREFSDPHSPRVHLAQELVDYIIDFLHDDPATLLRVSLISRAWVHRTRTYLCQSLKITYSKLSSSDPLYLTPLCKHVKALEFAWPAFADPSAILDCFEQSEPHTLAVHSCELHALREWAIQRRFAKFPCTSVTSLDLYNTSLTRKTFLVLLSLFPNVDDLTISVNEWKEKPGPKGNETIPRFLPPRLRGSFKSFDPPNPGFWGNQRGKLLPAVAGLPLQFQTVSLGINKQSGEDISAFLNSCSETARKVFIVLPYRNRRQYNWSDHFNFTNLEELRICAPTNDSPPQNLHTFLHLVTSPRLQRVIVEVREKEIRHIQWQSLDVNLVDLVERHGAYGNLVPQISTTADPEEIRGLLPRAAEKGILEVRFSERPEYCAY